MDMTGHLCGLTLLVVLSCVTPTIAQAQSQTTPSISLPASAPLADRIQNAIDRYQSAGERPSLDELKTLVGAADRDSKLDAGLRADLYTIFAYTLARSKQPDQALATIRQAQADYTKAGFGEASKMGDLLLAEAVFQDFTGDTEGALATKYRARAIYVKAEGEYSAAAARIGSQIAFSLFAKGQLNGALKLYSESLPLMADDADSVRIYATQLANYASALRIAGDMEQSLTVSQQALDIARAKLPAGHAAGLSALTNMGATLMEMGRYSEAETLLREASDQARQYRGKANIETAGATFRLGQVLLREGKPEDAQVLLSAALDSLDGVPTGANPDLPGLIRLELAQIAVDRDDLTGAQAHLEEGLTAIANTGHIGDMTRARLQTHLAEVMMGRGELPAALTQVESALPYYTAELPDYAPDRIRAGMLHALVLTRLGRIVDGLAEGRRILDAMTAHLGDVGIGRREQADLATTYQINFTRFTDIALAANQPEQAFEAAQLAALSEIATTSQAMAIRAATRDASTAELARQLQGGQIQRLRLDRERTFAIGKSETDVKRLDGEIASLDLSLKSIAASLDAVFPEFAALNHPHPISLASAQAGLGRGEAILMPVLSDDRVLTLVVTRAGLSWDAAPLSRASATSAIHALRLSIESNLMASGQAIGFDRQAAWQLGQALFTPKIKAALKDGDALQIVGSGPLMTLAFGALLTEAPEGRDNDPEALRTSAWLIKRYALSVKPVLLTQTGSLPNTQGFLGVGAPVLGPAQTGYTSLSTYRGASEKAQLADVAALRDLPSLPQAVDELQRMSRAFAMPESTLLTGADATETRIKSLDMSGYSVIAFATHGLISGNLSTLREPALVLTPPDTPSDNDDGLLTASDVAGLHINARWVILSACNTGSGREDGAAGYSGLAQAFMQAGAGSLLVSLWPVRDDIADRLGVDTVRRNARGASQPQALRAAVTSLINDRSVSGGANPAIWAPFSLVMR